MIERRLVLASGSPYRRELLQKLFLQFDCASPDINEDQQPGESPEQLVYRLARLKAEAGAAHYPSEPTLVIGSDQTAVIGGKILGKPGNHEIAVQQLTQAQGRKVTFLTSLTLYNSQSHSHQTEVVPFHVHFRPLTQAQIERYLHLEQPYNCAGSFKSEGLGIALFDKLEGDDPNTLIGLPLIRLIAMLEREGLSPLG